MQILIPETTFHFTPLDGHHPHMCIGISGEKRVSPGNEVGSLLSSFFGQQMVDLRVQAVKDSRF